SHVVPGDEQISAEPPLSADDSGIGGDNLRMCRPVARRNQTRADDVRTRATGVLRRASLSDPRGGDFAWHCARLAGRTIPHALPLLPQGVRGRPGDCLSDLDRSCGFLVSPVPLGGSLEGATYGLVAELRLGGFDAKIW